MIDWLSVFFNSLWIIGLALLLAALSYYVWEATENGRALRSLLGTDRFLRFFWIAFLLVSAGLAGTSQHLWETALWGVLALFAVYALVTTSSKVEV